MMQVESPIEMQKWQSVYRYFEAVGGCRQLHDNTFKISMLFIIDELCPWPVQCKPVELL
jgi:hypothetical protein